MPMLCLNCKQQFQPSKSLCLTCGVERTIFCVPCGRPVPTSTLLCPACQQAQSPSATPQSSSVPYQLPPASQRLPSLNVPAVDAALAWSWLIDIGQGDFAAAKIAAEQALTEQRNTDTIFARAVVHISQGEFAAAFPLFEEAFVATQDVDRQLLIASVAHLAERQRGDFLPDGFSLLFPETYRRWDQYYSNSLWMQRWQGLKKRVASSYSQFEATWIYDGLAMLPTHRTITLGLSTTANINDKQAAAQGKNTIHGFFDVARDLKLIGFFGPILANRTELIVLNDATKQTQGLDVLTNLIAGDQNNNIPQIGWLQLFQGDLLIMLAGSGHPIVFGYRLKDPGGDKTLLDDQLFDRAKIDQAGARVTYTGALYCFMVAGLPRGEAMTRMRLAYLDTLEGAWESALQGYVAAQQLFENAGDLVHAQAAVAGSLWTRLQLGKPGLDEEARSLAQTAKVNDALACGLGWGLAFAYAGREALILRGDVETALKGATMARVIFTELDAPRRSAQACGDRAEALQTLEATDAVTVELDAALNLLGHARGQWADEEEIIGKTIGMQLAQSLIGSYSARFDAEGLERTLAYARTLTEGVPLVSKKDIQSTLNPLQLGLQAVGDTLSIAQVHQKLNNFFIHEILRFIEGSVAVQAPLSRGELAMETGREEEAVSHFQTALQAAETQEDRDQWYAIIYTCWRRYPEARHALLQYIAAGMPQRTVGIGSIRGKLGSIINNQGIKKLEQEEHINNLELTVALLVRMKAWEDARRQLDEIIKIKGVPQPLGNSPTRSAISRRYDEGLLAEGLGDLGRARDYFSEAAEGLEAHRRFLYSETHRRSLSGQVTTQDIYNGWARVLISLGNWNEAFTVSERARARTLVETLGTAQAVRHKLQSNTIFQRYNEQAALVERLTSLLIQARRYAADSQADVAEQTKRNQTVLATEKELLNANIEFTARETALFDIEPHIRELLAPQTELLSLKDVAACLPDGTLLLAYLFAREHMFIWAITNAGQVGQCSITKFDSKPFLAQPFATRAQAWRGQLAEKKEASQIGSVLAQILLEPFDKLIEQAERLLIVPYAELNMVPFQALPWRSQALGLQKPLSFLPAASLLRHLRPSDLSTTGALVVGNPENMVRHDVLTASTRRLAPLPASLTEAQAVAAMCGTQPLTGAQATKTAVLEAIARDPKIIHFATHSYLQPGVPLAAGIALAHGDTLSVDELTGLYLKADLVVLSACDTGRGTLQGSELVGLARTLLYAGASAAVVSLWKVDDVATAQLMQAFYHRYLVEGQAIVQALRGAQLWMQQAKARELGLVEYWEQVYQASGKTNKNAFQKWRYYRAQPEERPFTHPYYWTAFTAIGV